MGADRCETFPAVPVDPNDRLRDIGEAREINVRLVYGYFYPINDEVSNQAWTAFDFPGRKGKVRLFYRDV
jgi:alpha-amylase